MLKIGSVFDGKYEILKQIGKGGTATVYLAMNQKLNQPWVIKEIDGSAKGINMQRVLDEANMMKTFDNPAIPRIVDIITEGKMTYIVMDYVSGQSLAYELKTKGPQPQSLVEEWGKQICKVLIYLHSLNPPIIYHDLKPGNIILKEPERNLKLIDFGEARPCINGDAPGGGKTLQYAAPEQHKETRGNTDQRTDIYCLGTTMYRLLTGKFPPMAPATVGSVRERFPELKITKGMDNIIKKCTQTDPDKRFQSAEEVLKAIENIVLWDDDYLKRLKKRVRVVTVSGMMAGVMVVAGIGFNRAAAFANASDYQTLLETSESVDYETRVSNYVEAIKLDGDNPDAYIQLLKAYEENGTFGTKESQQFSTLYNKNKGEFNSKDSDVVHMHYLIGRMYFNMYDDGTNSVRSKVLKAQEYFGYVHENGKEGYENYQVAASYYTLCDFFRSFVLNDSSVQEPSATDYEEMLAALDACLNDMQAYSAKDAAYTRLTLYGHILDMLNVNLKGLAVNGIDQKEVESVLSKIEKAAGKESVTQQTSVNKQKEVLSSVENVRDNLQREYASAERGL